VARVTRSCNRSMSMVRVFGSREARCRRSSGYAMHREPSCGSGGAELLPVSIITGTVVTNPDEVRIQPLPGHRIPVERRIGRAVDLQHQHKRAECECHVRVSNHVKRWQQDSVPVRLEVDHLVCNSNQAGLAPAGFFLTPNLKGNRSEQKPELEAAQNFTALPPTQDRRRTIRRLCSSRRPTGHSRRRKMCQPQSAAGTCNRASAVSEQFRRRQR